MSRQILVLNAGSSSIKFAVFEQASPPQRVVQGLISGLGGTPAFSAQSGTRALPGPLPASANNHEKALAWLFGWLTEGGHAGRLLGAGHRVVHGGERRHAPAVLDEDAIAELEALSALAPLHQPHNLAAIRALRKLRPDLPQVACFDTAFHRSLTAEAQALALPPEITAGGLRRYGFHGLSYEHIAGRLPADIGPLAEGKVIVAHLGNGASLCAMHNRRSIATTMGFSTLDGLVMGTRCGSIDPGVLFHLMHQRGMTSAALEELLYRRSGLLGVSGLSNDMRTLLGSTDPRAREAVALFIHRAVLECGAMVAALEGLDALVFTGGIGENAAAIRAGICRKLSWLGVDVDDGANGRNALTISAAGSRVRVCVIPTDEEAVIAAHTSALLGSR